MGILDLLTNFAQAADIETHHTMDAVYMHCYDIEQQLTSYKAIIAAQREYITDLTIDSYPPTRVGEPHRIRVHVSVL